MTSKNFKTAVIKTIKAGGCNCSRANFVGAYFAALKGLKGIPQDWIKKTYPAKNIIKHIAQIDNFYTKNKSLKKYNYISYLINYLNLI